MARLSLLLPGIIAATLALGCLDATQITVELSTNVPCDELVGATVTVSDVNTKPDTASPELNTSHSGKCKAKTPNNEIGTVVLVPSGDNEAPFKLWAIAGLNGQDPTKCFTGGDDHNCIIARRRLAFVAHTGLTLPIVLWEACRGNFCSDDQTCILDKNGDPQCVGALISTPEKCQTPGACGDPSLPPVDAGGGAGSGGGGGASSSSSSSSSSGTGGAGGAPLADGVFVATENTLYRYDVAQNQLTLVNPFSGCAGQPINDIAMDSNGDLYAIGFTDLFKVDKTTAACTAHINTATYPVTLSVLPKGPWNMGGDTLAGYKGSDYMFIDIASGAVQMPLFTGALGGFAASGDSALASSGKAYVTVTGPDPCLANDCLFEVDPAQGGILNQYPLPGYIHVSGLAYFGGSLYGVTQMGQILKIDVANGMATVTVLQTPGPLFLSAASPVPAP